MGKQSECMKACLGLREWPDFRKFEDHSEYYDEQRILREQIDEGIADAFELEYWDSADGCDGFDWRD